MFAHTPAEHCGPTMEPQVTPDRQLILIEPLNELASTWELGERPIGGEFDNGVEDLRLDKAEPTLSPSEQFNARVRWGGFFDGFR